MRCALIVVQLGCLQEAAWRRVKIATFGDYQRILSAVSDQKDKTCAVLLPSLVLSPQISLSTARKLHIADLYCQLHCFLSLLLLFCLPIRSYLQRDLSEPREERAVHRAGVARNVSDEDEG